MTVAPDQSPRILALRGKGDAGLRVGFLPVQAPPPADADPGTSTEASWPAPLDPSFGETLRGFLDAHTGFAVPGIEAGTTALADACLEARNRGCQVVAALEVTSHRNRYIGTNGWYWPNIFLWFYFWVPSFWVADEDYGARIQAELRVFSVNSERRLAAYPIEIDTRLSLDDFDRAWSWTGIFFGPAWMDQENRERIAGSLGPHALGQLSEEVTLALGERFRGFVEEEDTYRRLSRSAHALVIGISRYAAEKHFRRSAGSVDDARGVFQALLQRGIPAKNIDLLLEERATSTRIRSYVQSLVARAPEGDDLIIYFSGLGASSKSAEPVLLPHDADARSPSESHVSLAEIGQAIRSSGKRFARVTLILDCALEGVPAAGRCGTLDGGTVAARQPSLDLGETDAWVWAAVGPETEGTNRHGALVLEGDPDHGLFTRTLLDTLEPAAGAGSHGALPPGLDADGDETVSWSEISNFVGQRVRMVSELEGMSQMPAVYHSGRAIDPSGLPASGSWLFEVEADATGMSRE